MTVGMMWLAGRADHMAGLMAPIQLSSITPVAAEAGAAEGDPRPVFTWEGPWQSVLGLVCSYLPSDEGSAPRLVAGGGKLPFSFISVKGPTRRLVVPLIFGGVGPYDDDHNHDDDNDGDDDNDDDDDDDTDDRQQRLSGRVGHRDRRVSTSAARPEPE
jgi:hypothetical protein